MSVTLSNKGTYLPLFPASRPRSRPPERRSAWPPIARSARIYLRKLASFARTETTELFEPRERAVAAEQHQHLEYPGTCRAAGHRDARRVDKCCRFNVLLFRCSSHRRFHMLLVKGHRRRAELSTSARTCSESRGTFRCFVDGVRFVLDRFRQERPCLLDEVGEPFRARPQQLEQPQQPLVGRACRPAISPSRTSSGTTAAASCSSGMRAMYCPFIQSSFVGVEDRVAAADAFEREAVDQLRRATSSRGRRRATSRAARGN